MNALPSGPAPHPALRAGILELLTAHDADRLGRRTSGDTKLKMRESLANAIEELVQSAASVPQRPYEVRVDIINRDRGALVVADGLVTIPLTTVEMHTLAALLVRVATDAEQLPTSEPVLRRSADLGEQLNDRDGGR